MVTAGLACIIWLIQSLRFIEMIVNRGLSAGTFVYMTVLVLPNSFPLVLPIALFAIVVFIYSKMITDRELVVMRSTGLSQSALARPALLLALIVTLITYAINLFVIPESWRTFREMQWQFRYSLSHIVLEEGAFNDISDGLTVYLRERSPDAQLRGLLVHDNRDRERPTTYMAERGALVETEDGARLVLFDGNRQEMERATGRLTMLYFDRSTVDLGDIVKSPGNRYREARERTLEELFHATEDPTVPEKDQGKFTMEAHNRLASPLLSLSFTFVGLACLLSGAFTRRSQTKRVFLAIALLVALQAGTLSLQFYSARHLELVPLLYVNAVAPMVIGFLAMLRATDWRRRHPAPAAP